MEKINLFCLPFAGASRYSYKMYEDAQAPHVNVITFDLPGRGARSYETLLTDIHSMADDIFAQMRSTISRPYAIYGHSMGSILAYLITQKILSEGLRMPLHLFVTGASGPSARKKKKTPMHLLSKSKFLEALRDLGGSSDAILFDGDIMRYFQPILLADFQAIETYRYEKSDPVNVPITCMIGTDEAVSRERANAWELETTAGFELIEYPGKHFFIFDHYRSILERVASTLESYRATNKTSGVTQSGLYGAGNLIK